MNEKNTPSWLNKTASLLSSSLDRKVSIPEFNAISGGCINECFSLTTTAGKFFLKRNDPKKFPKLFEAEAHGLAALSGSVQGITPKVREHYEDENEMLLILEWIEPAKINPAFWNDFARKLSAVHHQTRSTFGFDENNYMGSLAQDNSPATDWNSFFIMNRIEPQLKTAIDERKLPKEIHRHFEKLFAKLPEIFPPEVPCLLHGDLWSGNFMTGNDGLVQLIDPAVYYGHREMDIAMTKLFGGFDSSFYRYYHEYFRMENSFEQRADVYNLYPLLIHVNLFGGHYATKVSDIIKRFVS